MLYRKETDFNCHHGTYDGNIFVYKTNQKFCALIKISRGTILKLITFKIVKC